MNTQLYSHPHRAQEVKAIWAVSKQTATVAKVWINRSSGISSVRAPQAAEKVGNIGADGDTDHSLSASSSTSNPFGNDPSPKYAVEDPAVHICRRSWGSKSSIATVADTPVLPRKQISLPTLSLDHSNEGGGTSLHHQAERWSFFRDNVLRLPGTSPIIGAEEDLEMAIIPVRNPSSRQVTDPTITSLTPPPQIVPSAALVEDPAPQQVDPKVDLIGGQNQIKRKFNAQTTLGIIACLISIVVAVATVYAAFRHGSSS